MSTLTLETSLSTATVGDRIEAVDLTLRFRNGSGKPVTVYPGCAQFAEVGGWGSPLFGLRLVHGQTRVRPVNLRTYYGPPGMPPGKSYFDQAAITLAPAKTHDVHVQACFIPRSKLPLGATDPKRLDPERMDGLDARTEDAVGVIALGRACATVEAELETRVDFLRPGLVLFVPERGRYELQLSYAQEPWLAFQPKETHGLDSKTVLTIE